MDKIKVTTRESYDENWVRSIEPLEFEIAISNPTVDEPKTLTKEDVWGDGTYKGNRGMRVAVYKEKCPILGDILEYKSTTFVCPKNKEEEAIYWIEFVYGGDCITKRKELDDLRVALRADYQCW